jgi:alkylation response protein AidB-like acyl-CoA dehydrogenase
MCAANSLERDGMADFGGELDAFRTEVRDWLKANYPAELKGADGDPEAVWGGRAFAGSNDPQIVWLKRVASRGWTTPSWPKQYGGGGLAPEQARVVEQELAHYRPALLSFGIWMLGPVLMEFANDAQKAEHLPKIVQGEIRWCQGYSEPGAGSDLASLQTRCEDQGDHWLINGQKIWTSYADHADWCFCLVRTDPTAKKHEGISFVLIDMKTPGVETRPIKLISGESPFCETFFTDVKIPKGNLVGRLNGGWEIAKRLLQYERQNISAGFGGGGAAGGGASGDLAEIAKRYVGTDEAGAVADHDLRSRITRNKMDFQSFALTLARVGAESRAGNGPSAATSIIKYAAAAFAQERSELMVEAMGAQGLGWEGESFSPVELAAVHGWLRAKANSIEGGTSEVNLNVVSKRVLGLPDPK